jgi:thiol-disulfide isomerase/thioredoxin
LRDVAIVVLLFFGVALIVPQVAERLERPLAALSRLGPRTRGDGFASGLLVGAALGFVYTPCAGPILAAVISVSAASGRAVARRPRLRRGHRADAAGAGARRAADPRPPAPIRARLAVQRTLGVVMVATAIVIATMLDVKLDELIAEHIPNVNITARSTTRAQSPRASTRCARTRRSLLLRPPTSRCQASTPTPPLPVLGVAPAFVGTEDWFNTPGDRPLTLAGLRGHVVLIDFWTYTCINCIRTLPYLEAWQRKYRDKGLEIIGVESPEFPFERDASNVREAIAQFGINYPVVQDNNMDTWNAWGNEYWPADYLIDAKGGCATTPSARATTRPPKRRSASCWPTPAPRASAAAAHLSK